MSENPTLTAGFAERYPLVYFCSETRCKNNSNVALCGVDVEILKSVQSIASINLEWVHQPMIYKYTGINTLLLNRTLDILVNPYSVDGYSVRNYSELWMRSYVEPLVVFGEIDWEPEEPFTAWTKLISLPQIVFGCLVYTIAKGILRYSPAGKISNAVFKGLDIAVQMTEAIVLGVFANVLALTFSKKSVLPTLLPHNHEQMASCISTSTCKLVIPAGLQRKINVVIPSLTSRQIVVYEETLQNYTRWKALFEKHKNNIERLLFIEYISLVVQLSRPYSSLGNIVYHPIDGVKDGMITFGHIARVDLSRSIKEKLAISYASIDIQQLYDNKLYSVSKEMGKHPLLLNSVTKNNLVSITIPQALKISKLLPTICLAVILYLGAIIFVVVELIYEKTRAEPSHVSRTKMMCDNISRQWRNAEYANNLGQKSICIELCRKGILSHRKHRAVFQRHWETIQRL